MSLQVLVRDAVRKSMSTTPGYMAWLQASICVTAVVFFLTIWYGVDNHRSALKIVCDDSAPSIIAAQHIKAALADLDANAANELLERAGENSEATTSYNDDRATISQYLVEAAKNITYGDAEQKPITDIENRLSLYEAAITRARVHHEAGDKAFYADYLKATDIMHGKQGLLDDGDALDKANRDVLDQTYNDQRFHSTATVILVLIAGAILLFTLARAQMYLSFKMRRTFNQGLLAATILAAILLAWTTTKLAGSGHDLKWAKEDAFDSVSALWKARAIAYDANGAESRWLLASNMNSSQRAAEFEQQFVLLTQGPPDADKVEKYQDNVTWVAHLPANETYAQVAQDCKGIGFPVPPGFTGCLAVELGNITFDHEVEAAREALTWWGQYMAIDKQIRDLENRGQHDEAVKLCCGNDSGQSNWCFAKFDGQKEKIALEKTLDINQSQFAEANQTGVDTLKFFEWIAALLTVGICALTVWGFGDRFKEYRV